MYDYEQEVEPVLQVLVGKSLETARYELMLEEEQAIIKESKMKFKQLKESMLMQT